MSDLAMRALLVAAIVLALVAVSVALGRPAEPNCPTEDSCSVSVDYRDGKWRMRVTEEHP